MESAAYDDNPGGRPKKHASAADRQAAYRARGVTIEFRADPQTASTLDGIAATLDVPRAALLLSMTKFALTNHDWARFGLTHKTIPRYQGNPMATKASPAQIAARKRFAAMAKSGALAKKRKAASKRNPSSRFVTVAGPFGEKAAKETALALGESNHSVYSKERVDADGYGTGVSDWFVERDTAATPSKIFGYDFADIQAMQQKRKPKRNPAAKKRSTLDTSKRKIPTVVYQVLTRKPRGAFVADSIHATVAAAKAKAQSIADAHPSYSVRVDSFSVKS